MIIKCTNCSGALKYDVATGKMKCEYCGGLYDTQDVEGEVYKEETMECSILTCTACSAELMVNKVEAATYCAYCGQPTIVFSRVSKMVRPDKIIPFSVTKAEAVSKVRERTRKGKLVPDQFKYFNADRIMGIYVPYWLYDITYYDNRLYSGKDYDYIRRAESDFRGITIDASSMLYNESSQWLEPFDMKGLKDFEEDYLSGFYADKYDVSGDVLQNYAISRCEELYNRAVEATVPLAALIESQPQITVQKKTYALLPVWFLTMNYYNKPYTILVNGQTGKVVGSVPVDKSKRGKYFLIYLLINLLIWVPFCIVLNRMYNVTEEVGVWGEVVLVAIVLAFAVLTIGAVKNAMQEVKKGIAVTSFKDTNNYAGDRQKGE